MKPADAEKPIFGASKQLDFELEMAFVLNKNTEIGENISTKKLKMQFWNGDFQRLECKRHSELGICSSWSVLGKNFCSSISPWW